MSTSSVRPALETPFPSLASFDCNLSVVFSFFNGTERAPKAACQDEKGAREVGVLLGLKVRRL